MSSPFLLNPSSLGFNLRSALLQGSQSRSSPDADQPRSSFLQLPESLGNLFSVSPANSAMVTQERLPASNGDTGLFFQETPIAAGVGIASVYSSQPRSAMWGPLLSRAMSPPIPTFCWSNSSPTPNFSPANSPPAPPAISQTKPTFFPAIFPPKHIFSPVISAQVAVRAEGISDPFIPALGGITDEVNIIRDPSKGKAPLILNHVALGACPVQAISSQMTQDTFFKDRVIDAVHVPVRAPILPPIGVVGATGLVRPIRANHVTGGNQINHAHLLGANQVQVQKADEASFLSLMNQVTQISQTQRSLDAKITDMKSHNLELKRQVVEVQVVTSDKILVHDKAVQNKIDGLLTKLEKEEKKSDKMEAKSEELEQKVTALQEKNKDLEGKLENRKGVFEKMQKRKKREGVFKYCCIGGFLVGVSIFALKKFMK